MNFFINSIKLTFFSTILAIFPFTVLGYQSEALLREDGSLIYYYLDKGERANLPLVLVLQGSNPESSRGFFNYVMDSLGEKLDANFLLIEKYGAQNNTDKFFSVEFLQHNVPSQRVDDAIVLLEHLKGVLGNWTGELILLGVSEGGAIANLIAQKYDNTSVVINIAGGGGMTMTEELTILNKQGVFVGEVVNEFEVKMRKVLEEPTWEKSWLGESNTHLYWSQMLSILPLDHVKNYKGEMMIFHGTSDDSVPIESSDLLVAGLDEEVNIQYHRVDGLNHQTIFEYAIPFIREWFLHKYGSHMESCNN